MARAQVFRGKVEKGRISLDHPESFKALLARLEGKDIALRLARHQRARSLSQNSYYWGVVVPLLAESCGYDNEEMHEALKWRFLERHDGPMPTVRSTATLNTAEFSEYVDHCRRLAAEMGVVIPDPGEMFSGAI